MSQSEKSEILKNHYEVYDGYRRISPKVDYMPIQIKNYANDNNGVVLNNKGDVMHYTNYRINESSRANKSYDLSMNAGFDYIEGRSNKVNTSNSLEEVDIFGDRGMYSDMTPAYDFDSEGPGRGGPYITSEQYPEDYDIIFDLDWKTEPSRDRFNPKITSVNDANWDNAQLIPADYSGDEQESDGDIIDDLENVNDMVDKDIIDESISKIRKMFRRIEQFK